MLTSRELMFTRCLFCHRPFPENGQLAHMPRGHRIAFDPVRGRLWAVCESCHRWNLCPIEDREAALYELERIGGRYGLATMCIGGGQGIALIVERG